MWPTVLHKKAILGLLLVFIMVTISSTQGQNSPVFYQFGYQVDDPKSGDFHGHMEQLEGETKTGEFKVKLPDGRLQVVTYEADKDGFRPKISYKIDPELAGELPEPKLPNEIMRPAVIYITPKPTYGYEGRSKPKPTTDYGRPKRPQYRPILTPSGGYDLRPKKRRHSNLDYDLTLSATEAAYAMPPSVSYSSPKTLFNNAKTGFDTYGPEPVINFVPREPESIKYNAPKMLPKPFLTPSTDYFLSNSIADPPLIRRHDVVDLEDEISHREQDYLLVPIRSRAKPILMLLKRKS